MFKVYCWDVSPVKLKKDITAPFSPVLDWQVQGYSSGNAVRIWGCNGKTVTFLFTPLAH